MGRHGFELVTFHMTQAKSRHSKPTYSRARSKLLSFFFFQKYYVPYINYIQLKDITSNFFWGQWKEIEMALWGSSFKPEYLENLWWKLLNLIFVVLSLTGGWLLKCRRGWGWGNEVGRDEEGWGKCRVWEDWGGG